MVCLHHRLCLFPHNRFSLLVLLVPARDVAVFLFKVSHLAAEISQVYVRFLLAHRADDDVLDEVGVEA